MDQYTDWKKARCGKLTASKIHSLMKGGTRPMTELELKNREKGNTRKTVDTLFGQGALTYIDTVIAEMVTGESDDSLSFKATEWGFAHELDAKNAFEKWLGKEVEYFGISEPRFFKYNPVSGGSPDLLIPGDTEPGGEIKCPYNAANHVANMRACLQKLEPNEWLKSEHPDYYAQAQMNMICCKRSEWYFISYDPRPIKEDLQLAVFLIKEDKEFQADLKARIAAATDIIISSIELFGLI